MQSIPLVPSTALNSSIYSAPRKDCSGGSIVLEDRITDYFMSVSATTAISVDTSLLNPIPNSSLKFKLIVVSAGTNTLNFSGFSVEQMEVQNGESVFTIEKSLGGSVWVLTVDKLAGYREQWVQAYDNIGVPRAGTGVVCYNNCSVNNSGFNNGLMYIFAPLQEATTGFGHFNTNNFQIEVFAKFPSPILLSKVCIAVSSGNETFTNFPTGLQVWGSNDGRTWTQTLITSLVQTRSSVNNYNCTSARFYTMFKFQYTFESNATELRMPSTALTGFISETIGAGSYSYAIPYATSALPLNGADIETNAAQMSSTSGYTYYLTQFGAAAYTMTRSSTATPYDYIFTLAEAQKMAGFSYKVGNNTSAIGLFTLSGSNDKSEWTEFAKVDGTVDVWKYGVNNSQMATYWCESPQAYKYYKLSIVSKYYQNELQENFLGLQLILFNPGRYFAFESFMPSMSSNVQSGYMLVASSSTQGDPYKMFDGDLEDYGGGAISDGQWSLLIQLPQATVVKGLQMRAGNGTVSYTPYAFSLQGSNDNSTWTNLKTFNLGSNYWTTKGQVGSWDVENDTAYTYYRLIVTASSGGSVVQIGELGLSSYPSFKSVDWYEDSYLVPVMASDSQDGYIITAKSQWGTHYAWKAFDRTASDSNDAWECDDTDKSDANKDCDTWIQVELPSAQIANVLFLQERLSKGTRDPRDFTLDGSNDGESWTTLLTQTDQEYESKTWVFENSTAYKYYRLNITKINQANDNVCIGILNLMLRTYHN